MSTFTIANLNPDTTETVTADTRADALRLVYETLVGWNRDVADCAGAIEEGHIADAPGGASAPRILSLRHDAEAFWGRCATLMLNDDQDFVEGTASPFAEEEA